MAIATTDPTTGTTLQTFAAHGAAEIERRLARAAGAFEQHRLTDVAVRASWMRRAADVFDADRERLARVAVQEMGKTIRSARSEVEKCALGCRYYAEHAAAMLADTILEDGETRPQAGDARVVQLPLGAVLAVMPWNFPYWQVVRFAAPALMAGNVALLKHASNVPQCALALEELFGRAGFPPGVFQTLLIESEAVADVVGDPRVAAVTLTGSEGAGQSIAAVAGRHLKKCVLELGGSDPFVVMPSADVAAAARTAVVARTINNGQSCIAAKRFVVQTAVYDRFVDALVAGMASLRVGDPMGEDTDLGPLATEAGRTTLVRQVDASVAAGARLLLGGHALDGPGWFYAATVLADIPPAAPAHHEEIFGPVALVHRVRDLDEAIAVANDTPYGLGSSVWTNDAAERARFVRDLAAGMTFVNAMVASDPQLPFGGVKRSGYGRELATLGLREFTNAKTIVVAGGKPAGDVE
ncbi:MAG: NAD-dependent succinate-semialdehyde dehydrogenase [Candidatus Binatia bacterium]